MKIQDVVRKLRLYWHGHEPVADFEEIDKVEAKIGARLPADYKFFLQWYSNGGEGDLPGGYLRLYPVGELLLRHDDYAISEFEPEVLLFGMEGDDVFCFDLRRGRPTAEYPIVRVSLSSRDSTETTDEAPSFASFLAKLLQPL